MSYIITKLSERLYFIRWTEDATSDEASQFVIELRTILEQSTVPICFFSDLTRGCITQLDALRHLADLATHPNWNCSTSFASMSSSVFSSLFGRLVSARQQSDQTFMNPQDALDYLERLVPGITDQLDWDTILNDS